MAKSTSRTENRQRIEREIIDAARRQLADVGADGLSLRSVAREIGMVSSAIYRYVESRDELLTRLIIYSYDSLGDATDDAVRSVTGGAERWVATAHAARDWAIERPHDYFLVFGSPVPGYFAPTDTVGPGTRVPRALVRVVAEARAANELRRRRNSAVVIPADIASDFADLRSAFVALFGDDGSRLDLADDLLMDLLTGWVQLFGLIGFELSNQTRGIVTHHRSFFDTAARRTAHLIGLR